MQYFHKTRYLSIFYRYLISYMVIFLIPLCVLSIILYNNSVSNLQRQIEYSNMSRLTQVMDNLDMRLKELDAITIKISNDESLIPYMMQNNGFMANQGVKQLGKYKAYNSFIEELMLYYRGSDSVFMSSGVATIKTVVNSMYRFEIWDEKRLYDDINNIIYTSIRPAETAIIGSSSDKIELIAYINPIPANTSTPNGTVVYLVRKDKVSRMISDSLGNFKGSVHILDDKNNEIVSVNNNSEIKIPIDMTSITREYSNAGVYKLHSAVGDLSMVMVKSEATGLTYMTIIPTNQFFKEVIDTKIILVIIFSALLLLGTGAVVTFSINNYKPIKSLYELINQQKFTNGIGEVSKNEIEGIRDCVVDAINQNRNMLELMNNQMPFIRDYTIKILLKGEVIDQKELVSLLAVSKINMKESGYCVMVVSWNCKEADPEGKVTGKSVFEAISSCVEIMENVFPADMIPDKTISLLVNLSGKDDTREGRMKIIELVRQALQKLDLQISIGVGNVYNEIMVINRSYIEALAALEYGREKNDIFFNDITLSKEITWYPEEERLFLIQCIKKGDTTLAINSLSNILKIISATRVSMSVNRYICYDVINTVVKTVHELNYVVSYDVVEALIEYTSITELEAMLGSLILKVRDFVESGRKDKDNKLYEKIIEYINNKYRDENMNLDSIASYFDLSTYYVSRFFREHAGINFIDYITQLRIDYVKNQLVTTDKRLSDIVIEAGYLDLPNFIRKFKKLVGITPGQYRSINMK